MRSHWNLGMEKYVHQYFIVGVITYLCGIKVNPYAGNGIWIYIPPCKDIVERELKSPYCILEDHNDIEIMKCAHC